MATENQQLLNREQRTELGRPLRSDNPGQEVMHPNAVGIDVGNSALYAAVRPDKLRQAVRQRKTRARAAMLSPCCGSVVCSIATISPPEPLN